MGESVPKHSNDYVLASRLGKELMESLFGVPSQQHISVTGKADEGNHIGNQQEPSNVASCDMFYEVNLEEGNDNTDHLSKHDTLKDEEITCISAQPSPWVDDRTKQNRCVKCNKDGQVLVCSVADCSVVVHEDCIGTLVTYDYKGDFCCPICAYSLANSRFLEAKEKLSWHG